jgi:glycerophosphoryl diester phosphodiesterase
MASGEPQEATAMTRGTDDASMPRFRFLCGSHPLAFAHRGGGGEGEENTLAVFARAVDLGYRYIETDVQPSRDGAAVVIHDPTLARTHGRPERVDALAWRELAGIVTPGGERLVRIDDALAAFPGVRFNIDPKADAVVEPLAEAIRRAGAIDRVCIGSDAPHRTHALRRALGPRLCWSPGRGGVAALWLAGWRLPVARLGFPCVQVPLSHRGIPIVTPRFIAAAHRRGIAVHVWTIDRPEMMERLLDLGADGIMTGRPTLLREVLVRRGRWPAA